MKTIFFKKLEYRDQEYFEKRLGSDFKYRLQELGFRGILKENYKGDFTFDYVGIIESKGELICVLPKYLNREYSERESRRILTQVMRVIKKVKRDEVEFGLNDYF